MMVDRTKAPLVHDAIDFDYVLPPIHSEKLDNGIPFYWLNAGVQEVVQINWVFNAGVWHEEKHAVAHAVAAQLKSGTPGYTAAQIADALEFYGASLKTSAGNDVATVTLYALAKHLPDLLPMVYEILTQSIFPESELEIYKQNATQQLMVNLRKCEFVANQRIDAMIFGDDHPYGRFSKQERLDALQRDDLERFYQKHYTWSDVQIFMAGKIDNDHVQHVRQIFGVALPEPVQKATNDFLMNSAAQKKLLVNNDPNGVQGAIRIGRPFPNRHHPDYTPMVVLNTLFGGYFGSRLMANIREEKGFTYGIYSMQQPELHGGALIIQTETGKDVIEAAVAEIYKEMELLTREPADEDELRLVKNYLLGNILGELDGPFSIMQRWRTLILNGFTDAQFNNNVKIYKSITAEQLQQLAQKYFVPSDFYEVIVV